MDIIFVMSPHVTEGEFLADIVMFFFKELQYIDAIC